MAETNLGILFLPAFSPSILDILIYKLKGVTWTFKLSHTNPPPGTASISVFYYKGLHPNKCGWLCGWTPLRSPHTSPVHPMWLFPHWLQRSSVPEASYLLAHHLFLLEPGITLLLPAGTRWNCYLQSNERKTWTLRRTFPSKRTTLLFHL